LDPVSKFPETTEMPGYFVGFVDNLGDDLNPKILENELWLDQLQMTDMRRKVFIQVRCIRFA
jgi:hypothetical protein